MDEEIERLVVAVRADTQGFARDVADMRGALEGSFGDGVDEAVNIVLGLIHFVIVMLPVLVLIVLPGGLLLRYGWRRFGGRRTFKKAEVNPQPEA